MSVVDLCLSFLNRLGEEVEELATGSTAVPVENSLKYACSRAGQKDIRTRLDEQTRKR
jgi:hypothetical protein